MMSLSHLRRTSRRLATESADVRLSEVVNEVPKTGSEIGI